MSKVSRTHRYRAEILELFGACLEEENFDDHSAEIILDRTSELKVNLKELLTKLANRELYANEELESNARYVSGYAEPKPIAEQVKILKTLLPELIDSTYDETIVRRYSLPAGAEGYFAIPRWEAIASSYGEAVQKSFDIIGQLYSIWGLNSIEGPFRPELLCQDSDDLRNYQQISQMQSGHDILVLPAQFGICHLGKSIRRARELFQTGEFFLGVFPVSIMFLTHPNRLQDGRDPRAGCAGDRYLNDNPHYGEQLLSIRCTYNEIYIDMDDIRSRSTGTGWVSAFGLGN